MDTQEPKPINNPRRNISYLRDVTLTPQIWPIGSGYHDDREFGPRHIRFDYDIDPVADPFVNDSTYDIYTPDTQYVEVDSANDVPQDYFLASFDGNQTLLRPFIDPIHKILVTYHFDRRHLKWVRMVTRLRKDAPIVRPPAMQMVNSAQYYWGSRGRRYVRNKPKVQQIARPRFISDRVYEGRSGISGDHGIVGEFTSTLR